MQSSSSLFRLGASLGLAATVAAGALNASTAAAASPLSCPDTGSSSVSYASSPGVCVAQQGNVVIIVVGGPAGSANPATTTTTAPAPPAAPGGTPPLAADPALAGSVAASADTYAQRQAIRDRYRGQIDDLTFNDELGDGISVYQALSDAMAARLTAQKGNMP